MQKIIQSTVVVSLATVMAVFFSNGWASSDTGPQIKSGEMVIVKGEGLTSGEISTGVMYGSESVLLPIEEARTLRQEKPGVELSPVYKYTSTVNDPLEPQGYTTLLDAINVWGVGTGSSDTVVAVIDSGFALGHEDLQDRWFVNTGESGTTTEEGPVPNCTSEGITLDKSCNNLDDDANSLIDDYQGWDFAGSDNSISAGETNPTGDVVGHGTAVAGFVGATGDNGIGVASLNWGATILPIQVFDDDGQATTFELAQGIAYALDMGADIINLSLGTTATDPTIEELIDTAKTLGVMVVVAAGNCGGPSYSLNGCSYEGQVLYPATNPYTVAVAATNLSDVRASFSSLGSSVDIAAPGTGLLRTTLYSSINPNGAYSTSISGTSFATPIVSGVAALVKDVWPTANGLQIRAILVDSASSVDGMNGQLFTNEYGFGRLEPYASLLLAQQCAAVAYAEDINCDDGVDLLDLSTLASQWNVVRAGRSDINLSGATDLLDLSLLASRWGY